jgi:methionyl-tRNA formyltransferase
MRIDRIAFFGTPAFAVPTLEALCEAGRRPVLVLSQPSRPRGRGRQAEPPPVAQAARRHGLPLEQPRSVRDPGLLRELRELRLDLAVVVAFGQIFPRSLLELPRLGCVNLHASLLPAYRGAAPIQAALVAGETETGVSTMQMDEGLDTGDVLLQRIVSIGEAESASELSERLAESGAALVVETIVRLERGALVPVAQDPARATSAPRLRKEDGTVRWHEPAELIARRIRAYTPWPGTTTELRGRTLRLLAATACAGLGASVEAGGKAPGTLLGLRDARLLVSCGGGTVLGIERVQRPGRGAIGAADLWNAERPEAGERLGSTPATAMVEATS